MECYQTGTDDTVSVGGEVVGALPAAMHKCVPRRFRSGALECDGSAVAEGGCCLNEWHGDGDEESIWQLLV